MKSSVLSALLVGLALDWSGTGAAQDEARSGTEFFEKRIRPVLTERCVACHSAVSGKTKGGLALDSREGLLKGGDSGPAVVPGDVEKSLLVKAIRYGDAELRMPPPKEKARLSPQQIADIETWIRQGAPLPPTARTSDPEWEARRTWIFAPPVDPLVPAVHETDRVRNGIDAFLLRKLESKGVSFAPEADKRLLLRRASFDLLGLPPSPAEIDAFLADESPAAFEKVVDRLLASPRYGERWGRHWLDLVRYCDEIDEIWRYRDWVIQAFNRDLPYDDFIVHQIMGDLLPRPKEGGVNADGIVATGVLTLGPWGGLDKKKMLTDIADDQIDLVGRTFLGLTLACARCHDHKYDPITTRDYYGLAGIFLSSHILSGKSYAAHASQRQKIPLLSPEQIGARERAVAPLRDAEARLAAAEELELAALARRLIPETTRYLTAAWHVRQGKLSVADVAAREGLLQDVLKQWKEYLETPPDGAFPLLETAVPEFDTTPRVQAWKVMLARSPWFAANRTDLEIHVDSFILPPRSAACSPGTAVAWRSPFRGTLRLEGKLEDADAGGTGVDFVLDLSTPGGTRELARGKVPNGGEFRFDQGEGADRLARIEVNPGDLLILHLASKEAHYDTTVVDLTIQACDGSARWNLSADVVDTLLEGNPHRDSLGNPGVWKFLDATGSRRFRKLPVVDQTLSAVYRADSAEKMEAAACRFQAAVESTPPTDPLILEIIGPRSPFRVKDRKALAPEAQAALAFAAAEVDALKKAAPTPVPQTCGIQEGGVRYSLYPALQDVPVHVRGSAAHLGEVVPRRFPQVLAGPNPAIIREGSGRRELARWLASPGNPLTARVMVNRLWQYHFGEGLVRTASNFGKLGEPPTHPELLDWLSHRFVESGWSMKAMHRLIMGSAAYRQSCSPAAETVRSDPDNRLWGHFPRRRLEAEELRDSILAVSGSLDGRPGGPADKNSSSLRRMLYLASTRGSRTSFDVAFDAANPAAIVTKRTSSTVAPQALYLMNDPWVLDRIRQLARRAGSGIEEARIHAAHRLVYGRVATAEELALGREFLKGDAGSAVGGPLLSAWELYVQALVLANEFMFVD